MISKNEIVTLLEIDWVGVTVALIMALCIVVLVWQKLDYIKEKLHIKTKRDIEHELLLQTVQNLSELQKRHTEDIDSFKKTQEENVSQSLRHDEMIKEELQNFMGEIRESISVTQDQISQFYDNRLHDREQSFEIQRQLTASIKSIAESGDKRATQIEALMIGSRELLGAEIDRRFDKYIALQGIPADEYDEFVSLHDAYNGCKGNHNRDVKFAYIIDNLPVLPVESKIKK